MRWVVLAIALVLAAGTARADDSDTSPDKDFFGFWRVIGAERAPWAVARGLKNGEAPLLENMISFDDEAVRGPPPFGCGKARYVTGQTAIGDVFDRRLDRDRYVEQGSVLGFMAGAETEHVACAGGTTTDYYLTHGGDVLVAVGDVLYRLRRPEGDPRDFKPGFSGPGFDCVAADNAARQTICLDLKLSALDRAMTAGYRRLAAAETPASFATVAAAQAAWFAAIVRRCDAGGPLPDHADDVAAIRDCLADLYPERVALFDGAAVATAGGAVLEPRMRFTVRTKPLFADTDCYPWLAGGGDADAFNDFAAAALRQDGERLDPAHLYVPPNLPPGLALTARRSYRVYRFDARVVSIQIRTLDFTGGSREDPHEFAIDWDRAKRAPIGFADLFPLDKDGLQFATAFALKDLTRQFGAAEPPKRDDVANVVTDPSAWLFTADGVTIHFNADSVADFSRGAFDVVIPYGALKDYLRPDAAPLAASAKSN